MSSDYVQIGKEILKELEIDPTRLGEALSTLNEWVRDCLESEAWNEIPAHCESAYELCDAMHGSEESREWSDVIDTTYAEGVFHAYAGISHLCQAQEATDRKNSSEEREEVDKAIHCLKKSCQSFHGKYRDQWNESIICLNLGRLYRSQNRLEEALLAFQRSYAFSNLNRLSIERMQEIERVALVEIEKTHGLFGNQMPFAPTEFEKLPPPTPRKVFPFRIPIIDEIAAGKEKPVSDDIIGYMRQTDEFEFEYEGQALKAELLRGSQLTFPPEYGCVVAVPISGDSMDQAGISPNDYVILQKPKDVSLQPSSGDIVAVVFRDEDDKATLKRFYFDRSSGSVTLKPKSSNPEHKTRVLRPEVFAGDNPSVEVVGIAKAVLKPQSVLKSQPETEVQQRRFTDIRFPEQCKINQPVRLSIQLTLKPAPGVLPPSEIVVDLTSKEVKERQGELTVVVLANNLKIDQRSRKLSIPFNKDSERIEFELIAQKPGPHIVEIEFFHGMTRVGYVKVFPK